jgi:hypothetical protein
MGMGAGEWSMFPNGNIETSTVVKIDTSKEGCVVACGTTDDPFGIAGPETHIMAIAIQGVTLDDGLAGVQGGPAIKIYGPGATKVPAKIGGTVTMGDRLKVGTSSYLVTASADGDKVIAVARQSGVASQVILVDVIKYERGA